MIYLFKKNMISKVFNEDCNIGMAQYSNGYFDLAVVDPPYGINVTNMQMGSAPNRSRNDGHGSGPGISTAVKVKGRLKGSGKLKNRILNSSEIDWDNTTPDQKYFSELFRISKNQIIWGGNYFPLPPTRCIICWDKKQPWDNFSQWEMAWTSFDMPAKMFRFSNKGGANLEKKIHPTQKPIPLYQFIYSCFGKPGFKIIDTHVGSGTSRIAADMMDMGEFVGYERNFQHFADQEKKFNDYKSQVKLF